MAGTPDELIVPMGFVVRPPALGDAEAVAELVNAVSRAATGEPYATPAQVRAWWLEPGRDSAANDRLLLTPDGGPAAYVEYSAGEPDAPYYFLGFVHPAHGGRGIGSAVLRWAEARARRSLAESPSDARVTLGTIAWTTQASAFDQLLRRHGYAPVRTFHRMLVELDAPPPEPQWPEGIAVRAFDRGRDERAVYEANEEAFRDHWGSTPVSYEQWVHRHIDGEERFDPALWFLAMDGDEVAGGALCRWERPAQPDEGHVRELFVRRPWRRRGIGVALLRHAFGEFYRRGKRKVSLTVDAESAWGAPRLYERAGMRPLWGTVHYEKELRPARPAAGRETPSR